MKNDPSGILYLIPTPLGPGSDIKQVSDQIRGVVQGLDGVIAESKKSALAFLRRIDGQRPLQNVVIRLLNEHSRGSDLPDLIAPIARGQHWGLVSDGGLPAVADPGSDLVHLAHRSGIRVRPLPGSSSILLALMSSGLNGQRFAFQGYLSKDRAVRRRQLKELEVDSKTCDRTEIWIETPYRNSGLFEDTLDILRGETFLCVAIDLTCPTEEIRTKTVGEWRAAARPDLKNRPAIFLLNHRSPL